QLGGQDHAHRGAVPPRGRRHPRGAHGPRRHDAVQGTELGAAGSDDPRLAQIRQGSQTHPRRPTPGDGRTLLRHPGFPMPGLIRCGSLKFCAEAAHPSHDAGPGAEAPPAEGSYMAPTQNTPARSARPARQRAILTVLDATAVSPRLVLIRLGGDTFDNIVSNDATDKYVKLLFADPAHGLVPPYDL